jgi:hypothetical protein
VRDTRPQEEHDVASAGRDVLDCGHVLAPHHPLRDGHARLVAARAYAKPTLGRVEVVVQLPAAVGVRVISLIQRTGSMMLLKIKPAL